MASFVWASTAIRNLISVHRIEHKLIITPTTRTIIITVIAAIESKSFRLYVRRFDGLFYIVQSLVYYQQYFYSYQFIIDIWCWWRTRFQLINQWREQRFNNNNIDSRLCSTLYIDNINSWWNYFINDYRKYFRHCCCFSRKKSSFSCLLSHRFISCCRFNGCRYGKLNFVFISARINLIF